jgi:rubredoxin
MNYYQCPVCGYQDLSEPPYNKAGYGSYEICRACGFQFGVSDTDERFSFEEWRKKWIVEGMHWRSSARKPDDWNPKALLKNVEK